VVVAVVPAMVAEQAEAAAPGRTGSESRESGEARWHSERRRSDRA